ncbi:MAG: HU family DNA-binding protein [Thermotogae bacterium]|nr:HU family DNA-binding protein [Thermotogota bacterium]
MTKEELVAYVAKKAGLKKADAYRAVNAFIDAVKDALAKGRGVRLVGFGSFSVRKRAARRSRNPRTGEPIIIPATKVPVFKPSSLLRKLVSGK